MSKLWGNRSSQDNGDPEGDSSDSHLRDPDERTALLPETSSNGHHHLNPDDPAVSPYNLLSVRTLRWFSILFFFAASLWWLLLLITTFISLPGFHTKGGGWFAFAYSTLAVVILLVLLLFYATPSKAERAVMMGILFFLLVDTILIIGAYPLRNDENWIGIASVVWALAVTAWAIMVDRVVEYGKHEEEERLTGCIQNRRTLRECCSILTSTIFLTVLLAASILFTINLSIRARDSTLPPTGTLYPVHNNKYHVHLHCVGNKTTTLGHPIITVLLEPDNVPVEGRLEYWATFSTVVQRYCYWDRPGIAWSENGPSPMSAGMVVDVLSEALRKAGEDKTPLILVSHGFGGVYSRIFASRHGHAVKGLLLVDTLPESLLGRVANPRKGFMLWLRGVLYPLGIDRLVSTVFLGHDREDRVYGKDAWQRGSSIKARLQENLAAGTFTKNELVAARAILSRDMPVVVVSSGERSKKDREWARGQREISEAFQRLVKWNVVDGAPHEVWRVAKGMDAMDAGLGKLVAMGASLKEEE